MSPGHDGSFEALRKFCNGDRDVVAEAVRELVQFDVAAIGKFVPRFSFSAAG